jgi:hypothetical protein
VLRSQPRFAVENVEEELFQNWCGAGDLLDFPIRFWIRLPIQQNPIINPASGRMAAIAFGSGGGSGATLARPRSRAARNLDGLVRVEGGGAEPAVSRARRNWATGPYYGGNGSARRTERERVMPQVCTICRHQKRHEIDQALLAGQPFRNIAERFGTSSTALFRHKQKDLPAARLKAKQVAEVVSADTLLDRLKNLNRETAEILRDARAEGSQDNELARKQSLVWNGSLSLKRGYLEN